MIGRRHNLEKMMRVEASDSTTTMKYMSNCRRVDSEEVGGHDLEGDTAQCRRHIGKRRTTRRYVFASTVFASLNTILIGYGKLSWMKLPVPPSLVGKMTTFFSLTKNADAGVMSGAVLFIQEDLKITEVQVEFFVGFVSFASLIGSLGGGKTADLIGRKWTMGLALVVFQAGNLIMTVAWSFEVLMVGRLLSGIGVGFGFVAAIVYIAEISPAVSRGSLTSFPEIFINFGILLGYVSNYAFSGLPINLSWRIMLGVGILPSVLLGVALFVIPESPRWLMMQNRIDDARLVLSETLETENEVDDWLVEIKLATNIGRARNHEDKATWGDLLKPSASLRQMLITGIGIQCFQQITGVDAIVYYSPRIFEDAGVEGTSNLLAATIAVGVTKTIFILVAIVLIDKLGRKPLLYASTIGMTICLFVAGTTLSLGITGPLGISLAILSVCGNVAFFSIGIGPICWVLTSEIFPLRLRALAVALGSIGNRVCSGLISMTFLSMVSAITVGGAFLTFFLLSALSVAFVYAFVPETKGKSLEQIESLFQGQNNSRRSKVDDLDLLVPK
ncbi:hypothetical protein MLD38_033350 [Melastoma candidum]|uniref:Uncharacterized protein n=1 Tax=Melastoma candidum TaxID=119954 RepID=A0ACB9M6G3_9MYRT|nr:hypothetical protein MLD38_033350 [Melastoma candidum]